MEAHLRTVAERGSRDAISSVPEKNYLISTAEPRWPARLHDRRKLQHPAERRFDRL